VEYTESELFETPRLNFAHPCGIPYVIVGETGKDDREPWDGGEVPGDHAIRGAYGTTTSLRDPEPMGYFVTEAMGGELLGSEGPNHQYRIGTDEGHGRMIELVEEPDLPQGTWQFGAGTIHHHAFDVVDGVSQAVVKDWIVGLGFTDVSDVKDRGYFFSVYCRTPGGALFELAQGAGRGFLVDETYEELGTNMCIPPHWEHRRAEIATLEPIVTREAVA